MDVAHVHSCTKFCNKIWQAFKFFLLALEKTKLNVHPLDEVRIGNVSVYSKKYLDAQAH